MHNCTHIDIYMYIYICTFKYVLGPSLWPGWALWNLLGPTLGPPCGLLLGRSHETLLGLSLAPLLELLVQSLTFSIIQSVN